MPTKLGPREEFIQNNLGLVHACAGRFRGRGIEYDDLYSAGCMGLVKAYDGFDEQRGVQFSTYAVPVILGEIKKLFRDGGTVKVNALRESMIKNTGAEPTVNQLAEALGERPEQVALAIRAGQPAISLTPAADAEDSRQLDIPVDSPEEDLADRIGLEEVLSGLPPRDRTLIYLRFFSGKTQSETARVLGTTQVQISRRERKILKEMRELLLQG